MKREFLVNRLPLWGWLPFLLLDFATKIVVMRAIGYPWGSAVVSATLSSPGAALVGLLAYHPFERATAARYGAVYFALIVAAKLVLAWSSGVTEVRGGVLLVDHGSRTFAGALEMLMMAFGEASLSTLVLLLLQALLGVRRRT